MPIRTTLLININLSMMQMSSMVLEVLSSVIQRNFFPSIVRSQLAFSATFTFTVKSASHVMMEQTYMYLMLICDGNTITTIFRI
jgi:hypothetical protein